MCCVRVFAVGEHTFCFSEIEYGLSHSRQTPRRILIRYEKSDGIASLFLDALAINWINQK